MIFILHQAGLSSQRVAGGKNARKGSHALFSVLQGEIHPVKDSIACIVFITSTFRSEIAEIQVRSKKHFS